MTDKTLEQFMLESNRIEGEEGLNPKDFEVAKTIARIGFKKLSDIRDAHRLLTAHLGVTWSGKWRKCNVYVGSYAPSDHERVPDLMIGYWAEYEAMDSFEAHNEFELIHPFTDFNGRMGRLIWLSKAIDEGYVGKLPFLQVYYYQTLRHWEGK